MNDDTLIAEDAKNQSDPGIQKRRYRLIGIEKAIKHYDGTYQSFADMATLELVPIEAGEDQLIRHKVIETTFLPLSSEERRRHLERNLLEAVEPIEFEVTVRRVIPTPGHVSVHERAWTAEDERNRGERMAMAIAEMVGTSP